MATRKAGLGFILVTLFLDILGIGIVIPILPKLLGSFVPGEAAAASWYGVFVATYAVMQFVFSPILGSLSDRFGRRPVLMLSLLGQGLDYLLLFFAPSLAWLFVGRVISGLTGASIGTATAYIADVSPPEKRAQNFGLVGMAFGLGFIAGPALGGILGGGGWLKLPFLVASGLSLTNAAYGFFVLPESLAPHHRRAFDWKRANPLGTMAALGRYPIVLGLALTIFLVNLAQRSLESTWVLYSGHRYGWDVRATGLSLAAVGLGAALVQGGLVRRIIPALGERRAMLTGIGIGAVSFVLYGLASKGWMLYSVLPFASLGGIAGPAAQGILSRSVPANEQGMLQGALASLQSVTQIIGPLLATNLFAFFIGRDAPAYVPGAAFFAGSAFLVVGLLLAVRAFARQPQPAAPPASAAADAG